MTEHEIQEAFTYHKPFGSQTDRYALLRNLAKKLAEGIDVWCPDSREKSTAFTKLREAVMWANASIACNEHEEK